MTASSAAQEIKVPATHPRLLIHQDDLAALRFRCGIERYRDDPVARARKMVFGSQREPFDRLRQAASTIMVGKAREDDLWAPAFLHLVTAEAGTADTYSEYVTRELLDPDRRQFSLDAVAAFDWCYEAIPVDRRSRIAERMADMLQPMMTGESPVNDLRFQQKLLSLAAAIVLHESKPIAGNAKSTAKVAAVLKAAGAYMKEPFLRFCEQRGAMPTSGGKGVWEEANLVLAVELWRTGMGHSLWPQLAETVGRAMEHYFYADTESESLAHGFIHDDGSDIPSRPGTLCRGFAPAVAHAIAANTRDSVATWYAHRTTMVRNRTSLDVDRYSWVPLLYGPLEQSEAARRACPLGRDFGGGWIAMRSGWQPGDTVVLFDAGQPFWRARQHFDAGQFQIYRKGRLAIDSGDDVTFEAVTSKGGRTTIGSEPGDWDEYFQATIAHNCLTVMDRSMAMNLYGRQWFAPGNQRLIEHDCDPSADDVSWANRFTGELTAFETNSFYSYATVDLSSAYPSGVVKTMERRLLFINDGVLCVLDRLKTVRPRVVRTWHLQLPGRPALASGGVAASSPVDGRSEGGLRDLRTARQTHGLGEQGGIWELGPDVPWTVVTHGNGRLFARTLLPERSRRLVIGGPMVPHQIPAGTSAGRTYYGSEPMGYEYRLTPAVMSRGPNAAYVLDRPTGLGENFGVGATWGRLDVTPADDGEEVVFLHLLIPVDATRSQPPVVRFEQRSASGVLDFELNRRKFHIELSLQDGPPGKVLILDVLRGTVLFDAFLAVAVQPNLPIPGGDEDHSPATSP